VTNRADGRASGRTGVVQTLRRPAEIRFAPNEGLCANFFICCPTFYPNMEIAIFRIVQECLSNLHRHSGSATAAIRPTREGDPLVVRVQDNGKGISLDKRELIE
jgi:signal transduction histidine kinase